MFFWINFTSHLVIDFGLVGGRRTGESEGEGVCVWEEDVCKSCSVPTSFAPTGTRNGEWGISRFLVVHIESTSVTC